MYKFTNVLLSSVYAVTSLDGPVPCHVGFTLHWECEKLGFGEATFYTDGGKARCDDEAMSLEFIEALLVAYAKTLTLTHR